MASSTANMSAQELAAFQAKQAATNSQFLHYAIKNGASGSILNGNSITANTKSLKFQISGINGGWLRHIRVVTNGSFDYTPDATSPTCSVNAVGLDGIYSGIKQTFGSSYKPIIRPIFFRILDLLRGYGRISNEMQPLMPFAATDPTQSAIASGFAPGSALTSGNNAFLHTLDIPLQTIHDSHPSGILPIDTTGSVFTLELVPNLSGLIGNDPLDNFVNTNGTVTWGPTSVAVTFYYSDGQNFTYTQYLQPNMVGVPTAEYAEVTDKNLVANQLIVQELQLALPIAKVVTFVIDGMSSSQFAQVGTPESPDVGVTQYALLKGNNTANSFISYDSTNGGVSNYYNDFRRRYGFSLPAGVFVYNGITANVTNPSNQNGLAFWDTSSGVWASSRIGVNVANVGTNGQPRMVTTTIVQNPAGIL